MSLSSTAFAMLQSLSLPLSRAVPPLLAHSRPLSTTPAALKRNKGKQIRNTKPHIIAKFRSGPRWISAPITPTSPLQKTEHPEDRFAAEEEALAERVEAASAKDMPMGMGQQCDGDPYEAEPVSCVLCPRRYAVPVRPSWKNPKLLAQFVSSHSGLVYDKHVTGLCTFMQEEVEREVGIAQKFGINTFVFHHSIKRARVPFTI